jgi:hypothetical protein
MNGIWIVHLALANLSLYCVLPLKITFSHNTFSISKLTHTGRSIILPLAIILITVTQPEHTLAMSTSVLILTCVLCSIPVLQAPLPMKLAFLPLPMINIT